MALGAAGGEVPSLTTMQAMKPAATSTATLTDPGAPEITGDEPYAASRYTTVESTGRSAGEAQLWM